jgi:hypothetical protein
VPTSAQAAPLTSAAAEVDASEAVQRVVSEAARRQGVPASEIQVVSVEPRRWPDTSLGCGMRGHAYAQVLTPGFAVLIRARGMAAEYHVDRRHVVRCS